MPPDAVDDEVLSIRRSRRLSRQEPKKYYEEPSEIPQSAVYSGRTNISVSPTSEIFPHSNSESQLHSLDSESFQPARVSRSRRRPKGNPPRPPNAFMLFRSDFWAREKQKEVPIGRDHRDISRIAGHCWNNLDDEERARYKRLAAQRKELHNLEHPGYRYIPSIRRERTAKPKSKKGSEEEEERCRKLASFVMEGLSHADLREAMKYIEKKPSKGAVNQNPSPALPYPCRRSSHTLATHPITRAQKAVEVVKLESLPPSELPLDGFDTRSIEGTIRIDDACCGALTTVKKEEEDSTLDSYLRPPSYDVVDSQFSFKQPGSSYRSPTPPDSYLWYNFDEVSGVAVHDEPQLPSFPDDSFDFAVDFTNPFSHFDNEGHFTPVFDHPQEPYSSSSTFTTMVNPLPSVSHDSEMSRYFHFDF